MSIEKIKDTISDNLGNNVEVIYNEGRNKIFVYRGKIEEVYSNLFIIYDNDNYCKRCFSYYDILNNILKILF